MLGYLYSDAMADSHVLAASEFLGRLVEEAAASDHGHILFMSLEGDKKLVDNLIHRLLSDTTSDLHMKCIIDVLYSLTVKARVQPVRPFTPATMALPPPKSTLTDVSSNVCRFLSCHLVDMTSYIIDVGLAFSKAHGDKFRYAREPLVSSHFGSMKYSSYVVHRPLSTLLLKFLECFLQVLGTLEQDN